MTTTNCVVDQIEIGQPAARRHAELGVSLVEVIADGTRAEEELPRDLTVGGSGGASRTTWSS
jgi:hypothetical protein